MSVSEWADFGHVSLEQRFWNATLESSQRHVPTDPMSLKHSCPDSRIGLSNRIVGRWVAVCVCVCVCAPRRSLVSENSRVRVRATWNAPRSRRRFSFGFRFFRKRRRAKFARAAKGPESKSHRASSSWIESTESDSSDSCLCSQCDLKRKESDSYREVVSQSQIWTLEDRCQQPRTPFSRFHSLRYVDSNGERF